MEDKTTEKRRDVSLKGPADGVKFSSTNQPSSEAKKQGWEERRKQRYLTQEIIKKMIADDGLPTDTFNGYISSLITNAKNGNAKAIETVNRAIEEDIIKSEIAITGNIGTYDLSKLSDQALNELKNARKTT